MSDSGRGGGGGSGGDGPRPPSAVSGGAATSRTGGAASSANPRKAALDKLLNKLKNVPNREALEEQWDKWLASRKIKLPRRFNAEQRSQLRKFFQVMDADHGGTIELDELEGPLLSTGMVINHAELQALVDSISSSDEITFWEFLEAFRPKPGGAPSAAAAAGGGPPKPDMKKLRVLLATAEHESLAEAFARDHREDGLSDAEEEVIGLYTRRAEGVVRHTQRERGATNALFWYERLNKGLGGGGGAGSAADAPPTARDLALARAAEERRAAAAAVKVESHLTLNTRIGLHRRRFLLATIMQEKDRFVSKRADLTAALRGADARTDAEESAALRAALKRLEALHGRRKERLEATKVVVLKERGAFAGSEGGGSGGEEEEEEEEEDEPMPWMDEEKLAAEGERLKARLPRFETLLSNCQRLIAAAEASAAAKESAAE
jgi:hypothetical protein